MTRAEWLLCEGPLYGYRTAGCLYDSRGRFHSDPPRCIKHGAPLFHRADLDGLPRSEARKKLKADADRRAGKHHFEPFFAGAERCHDCNESRDHENHTRASVPG